MKSSNFLQLSLLLVCFLFSNGLSAQHKLCGHELVLQSMEEKYPFYAASEADRLRYLRECREADQDPMYAPSLAGLSLERWQSYCQDRDIVLLQPTTLHKHKTKLPKLEEVVIE